MDKKKIGQGGLRKKVSKNPSTIKEKRGAESRISVRPKSLDSYAKEANATEETPSKNASEKNRGRRLQECLQLLQFLQGHRTVTWTFKKLAEEFHGGSSSEAAIKVMKRLVADLSEMGAPIIELTTDGEIAPVGWKSRGSRERQFKYDKSSKFAEKLGELNQSGFTPEEYASLLMVDGLLEKIGGMHARFKYLASPTLRRLGRLMPAELAKEARSIAELTSFQGLGAGDKYIEKANQIRSWEEAVLERKQVRLTYESPGKNPREHVVAPMGFRLNFVSQSMLLVAAREDSSRTAFPWMNPVPWKLDRVLNLEVLKESAPPIRELLANSEGVSAAESTMGIAVLFRNSTNSYYRVGEPYINVEIAVTSPRWHEYIQEGKIHPNQEWDFPSDDPIMHLKIKHCQASNILPLIMPMAPDFEVLAPAGLRAKVKKILAGALAKHK